MKKVFTSLQNFYVTLTAIFIFSFQFVNAQVKYEEKPIKVTQQDINNLDEATIRAKMRADGLFDPVIDKLLAQRKLWTQKGKNYNWLSAKNGNTPNGCTPATSCACNGLGVESGWGCWQWQNGTNSGANPPVWSGSPANNPTTPFYTITSGAGVDPNTPSATNPSIPVVCPGFGNNSIKIGDDCGVGSNCNQLTYPLKITAQDTNFVFAYAVVIEDAGHLPNEQPYCEIAIYDNNCNAIQCVPLIYTGGANIPGFYPVSGGGCAFAGADQYKPWTLVGVNLNQYVGQTLNVVITNCDCIYGGHFCYSYWDFLCGTASLSAGCFGNQSTICGPIDPQIAYTYTWSVNGVPIPPPQGNQQCITVTPQAGDTITCTVHQPSGCDFHLTYVPASLYPNFNFTSQCGVVTFTDSSWASPSSVNVTGWNWSFPGGSPTTANTSSAVVTYNTPGNYAVTCTVTCSAGCTAVLTKTITVTGMPTAAFSVSTVCAGVPTQFTDNSIPAGPSDPIVSWSWSFPSGNPSTSTSQNPTVTYPAGNYAATLTVTSQGGCTAVVTQSVTVNPLPVASMSGKNVCFNNASTFTDLSTGNNTISSWNWTFPNGNPSSSSSQNPSTTFGSSGTFSVSLTVTNNFGCKDSTTITVIVNPLPVSSFTYTPVCVGDQTCFQDLSNISSGTVTGWSWNFGDPNSGNNISNLQNPCHTFSGSGTGPFTVLLTVTSDSGCQSNTQLPVNMNPLPTANFNSTAVCLNATTNFTDASQTNINAWSWDFGDPTSGSNTSTSQNPTHVFSTAGNYTVTEIVTDKNGCKDTVDKPVVVYNPPVAAFTTPDSGCAPVVHCLNDASTAVDGNVAAWEWSFPGGSPSSATSQNACSSWNTPGSYGIQLIVTTNYGCKDTLNIPNYINVFSWPTADFCVSPATQSVSEPNFTFCPLWSSDVTQWTWNFGDGSPLDNSSTNPAHSYSAVATNNDFYTYNICINVKNVHGCYDTICHSIELEPEFEFYIANCVTPNGDGINDFFFGKCRGVRDYTMWIFDRWGNLIWDCHHDGKNTDWDNYKQDGMSSACQWDAKVEGGNSDAVVQEDVYVWKVRLTDIFDKVHNYIGHVSVVK